MSGARLGTDGRTRADLRNGRVFERIGYRSMFASVSASLLGRQAGRRARAVPASCLTGLEVKWTTSGVPGTLEEVADKEPS